MTGVPELRQAIAGKVSALYHAEVDVDQEITVTSGATDALFTAIATIVNPGDEVTSQTYAQKQHHIHSPVAQSIPQLMAHP